MMENTSLNSFEMPYYTLYKAVNSSETKKDETKKDETLVKKEEEEDSVKLLFALNANYPYNYPRPNLKNTPLDLNHDDAVVKQVITHYYNIVMEIIGIFW